MRKIIFIIQCLSIPFFCLSQESAKEPKVKKNSFGIIRRVEFPKELSINQVPESSNAFFQQYLKISESDEFRKQPTNKKKKEIENERFFQYYKGIKVVNAGYVIHYRENRILRAHGNFVKIPELDITPTVSPEEAKNCFVDYKNISPELIRNFDAELLIKEIPSQEDDSIGTPMLVYKIYLIPSSENNTDFGIVDAHNCKVLLTESAIAGSAATGEFETKYNGNRQANTESTPLGYRLLDLTRDASIHTWNLDESYDFADKEELYDANNDWTSQEFSPNDDDMGLDIHWALQQILDRLEDEHQKSSFDNLDFDINAFFHYGSNHDNAEWFFYDNYMVFGDGNTLFKPTSSLDMIGHESGHGMSDIKIGWEYYGIYMEFHEGLSDIWAVIFESQINANSIWQIGEEVVQTHSCLRNIEDPDDEDAETQISNTYLSTKYNYGNQYVKSGVFSYWFYLLVEGGSGTNDVNHSYSVYGLGMDDAEKIIVEAVFGNHLANTDNYSEVREAMIDAAEEEFGTNSIQSLQVKNAWYAVGVGSNPGQVTITLPTNNLVCSSGGTFTVNNVPSGHTVSWNYSAALTLVSASGNNATFNTGSTTSSSAWIEVTINNVSDGTSLTLPQFDTWCGKPQVTNKKVDGSNYYTGWQICPGDHYLSGTPTGGDAGTIAWTVPYGIVYFAGTNTLDFTFPSLASSIAITARSSNTCGAGPNSSFYLTKKNWGCSKSYSMVVYPNPASDEVTITMNDNLPLIDYTVSGNTAAITDSKANEPTTYTVSIYDDQSTLQSKVSRSGNSFSIPTVRLPNGTYILEVSDGKNSYQQQLIINHN